MNIGQRLQRAERQAAVNDGDAEVKISVNVEAPEAPDRERDARGLPVLTAEETAAVAAGDTICFLFSEPPRHVSFTPDGGGGVIAKAR